MLMVAIFLNIFYRPGGIIAPLPPLLGCDHHALWSVAGIWPCDQTPIFRSQSVWRNIWRDILAYSSAIQNFYTLLLPEFRHTEEKYHLRYVFKVHGFLVN